MLRWLAVGLLFSCAIGCVISSDFGDDYQVSAESQAKIDALSAKLQSALQNKDWAAVAALYWPGANMTAEKVEAELATIVDQAGPLEENDIYYYEYDKSDLIDEIGAAEMKAVGAPDEVWHGYSEIVYGSGDMERGMEIYLEVGEIDGQFVILSMYDVGAFDDR